MSLKCLLNTMQLAPQLVGNTNLQISHTNNSHDFFAIITILNLCIILLLTKPPFS